MARFKRPESLFFCLQNRQLLDLKALLQGRAESYVGAKILTVSALTSSRHSVDLRTLEALAQISSEEWSDARYLESSLGLTAQDLEALAHKALLLSDADEPSLRRIRRRAEALQSQSWHSLSALYHFQNRSLDEDPSERDTKPAESRSETKSSDLRYESLSATAEEDSVSFVARHGPPPPLFHHAAEQRTLLPLTEDHGQLYELLRQRRTIRAFNSERPLPLEDLSSALHWTFGYHGYTRLSQEVTLLHRTSPSGGARQPVEAYLLVLNVEGYAPGLYHYDPENHALERIRELEQDEARELAIACARRQAWAGEAHALVFMTVKYYRNFWKYRNNLRTYYVLLMDAAHLSQTFALVAEERGLGTFFSMAINIPKVDQILELNSEEEGTIACCGIGIKHDSPSAPVIDIQPFIPRKTKI